ncbi:MAG: hypothetical protein CSA04_02095, partial [Bacteroidetes bacterium]
HLTSWEIVLLDVNFKPVWSTPYQMEEGLTFQTYERNDKIAYLTFSKKGKSKTGNNLRILRVNLSKGEVRDQATLVEGRIAQTLMAVNQNNVVIGVEREKEKPLLLYFDFNTPTQTTTPIDLTSDHKILSIRFNKEKNEYAIITSYALSKETQALHCYFWTSMSNDYQLIQHKGFLPHQIIQKADLITQGDSVAIIIGGYHQGNTPQKEYSAYYGTAFTGLFSFNINNDSLQLYPFHRYENILNIVMGSNLNTTRKRKEKKLDITLYLTFHKPEVHHHEIVLLKESYTPQFHTVSSMSYDYYGRPLTTYYDVFDGYRYHKAIISAFDLQGNLTWSNQMDIRDVINETKNPICTLRAGKNHYMLAYAGKGNVASQVINQDHITENITVANVDLLYPKDRLMETTTNRISPWYHNFYLVYGYQSIRNSKVTSSGKRTVFYMSKMAYQ